MEAREYALAKTLPSPRWLIAVECFPERRNCGCVWLIDDAVVRLAQRFERVEYRGDWASQATRADIIATPAFGIPVALFEPSLTHPDY